MSTNAAFGLKLGASTSNYYWTGIYMMPSSATVNGENGNNDNIFEYVAGGDTANIAGIITVIGPNLAKPTNVVYNAWRGNTPINLSYMGTHTATTQHTDFTLVVDNAANATGGTIRVYGYQKS
jgi:filamentous hemagglutinin family protein